MKEARATRDAAGLITTHDDVWTYRPDDEAEGEIASPPCQTFSKMGSGSGRKAFEDVLSAIRERRWRTLESLRELGQSVGDERTALVLTPLHFAMNHPYRWLAWEQVPSVLPVWEACAEVLRAEGFYVWTGVLHSEQYGVPQTRNRAVLIASVDHPVGLPEPTHSQYHLRTPQRRDEGRLPWVSIAEALGWTPDSIESKVNNQSGSHFDLSAQLAVPSSTIAGGGMLGFRGANANRYNGATKSRNDGIRLTVQEAGILQSFPADFPWRGSLRQQYLQVGNAVPPLMAEAILKTVF